ncbi:MAG TPA: hypothetical protein VLL54_06005 [Pyrinomonadaceae bacterium]|nr:hypothetical protein [Pyrinomonadaceae bacterium]
MKLLVRIICASALVFVIAASGFSQTEKVDPTRFQFGDQVITIPAPEDFEEAASQFPTVKNVMTRTEAQGNDMLAVHLPHADCEKLRAGESVAFNFYTKVSARSAIRESDYPAAHFAELIAEFRKTRTQVLDVNGAEMKSLLERLNQSLSDLTKSDAKVDMNQPIYLGEFDTRPNVYSSMILMTIKSNIGDGGKDTVIAAGLTFLRVKQRLIYVYTYRRYESKADIETVRDFTKKWVGQILAAN